MLSTSNGAWPRRRLATEGFVSVTLQKGHGHRRRQAEEDISGLALVSCCCPLLLQRCLTLTKNV